MNLLVSGFLDFAEFQALEMNPMTMKDWIEALDNQIIAHKRKVLIGKGNISHKQAIEKAEKYLAEKGYAGLLSYYDQGYSDISDNLSHFFSISVKLLLVGIIGWCGFLAVFLFMFSAQQKSEAVRLWTLGAPKALVVRNYLAGGIGIALPGTILGGALSFLIMRNVFQGLSEQTGFTLDAAQTPLLIAVLLVVQLTVIVGLILLVAGTTVRRLYK